MNIKLSEQLLTAKRWMKCSDCTHQDFMKFDAAAVEKHLTGKMTVGVYPMLADETEQYLCLPRGLEDEINQILKDNNVEIKWIDKTNEGRKINRQLFRKRQS